MLTTYYPLKFLETNYSLFDLQYGIGQAEVVKNALLNAQNFAY